MEKCKICDKEYGTLSAISKHMSQKHKIKYYDYLINVIGVEHPICPVCKKNKIAFRKGAFKKYCSFKCSVIANSSNIETNKKRGVGVKKFNKDNPEVRQKVYKQLKELYKNQSRLDKVSTAVKQAHKDNPELGFGYRQVIIDKQYFIDYKNKYGEDKLRKMIPLLLKFIYKIQPTLPKIELTERLTDVIDTIRHYDLTVGYDENKKEFRNTVNNVGINYLKYHFNSYWDSSYKNRLSPTQAWVNPTCMSNVIAYRIGLNNSNEVFNFSLYDLMRGLSAKRFNISFFKPLLAGMIYKKFLGETKSPVVFDPCAGFGGRLLGFKSVYPHGIYIGVESNRETFKELKTLADNFDDVILIDSKIEDVTIPTYDFAFTSIPYFDLEVYSDTVSYVSFDDWKDKFIGKLLKIKNMYINLPESLLHKLDVKYNDEHAFSSTASHFSNTKVKKELIVRLQ